MGRGGRRARARLRRPARRRRGQRPRACARSWTGSRSRPCSAASGARAPARSCARRSPASCARERRRRPARHAAGARLRRARGLRGRARPRLRALVDLRLPGAGRRRAGLVRDRQRRRRAGRRRARRRRRAARALERLPPPRDADPLRHRARCPKVLRCPYHGWTYRQDGQLAAVPEARGFAALDREGVRLPAFRVESLAGLVFVSLDADVPPLAEWFGDARERLESLGIGGLKVRGPARRRVPVQLEEPRRQLPRGLPHPGRPSRPAAHARLQALRPAARRAPRLDQRAAARQALGRAPRAALPAARAADGGLPRRPARVLGLRAPLPGALPRPLSRSVRHLAAGPARRPSAR